MSTQDSSTKRAGIFLPSGGGRSQQRVEIDVPGRGRVVVLDRANQQINSGAV